MRRLLTGSVALLVIFAAGSVGEGAPTPTTLVLKTAWAKKFRNLLSIDARVNITQLTPHVGDDGDVHGGSRKNAVGLPMVAEILNGNAPTQKDAREALKPVASAPDEMKDVYGAWRLWFEHPPHTGSLVQCQIFGNASTPVPSLCSNQSLGGKETNPDHSFEIHPVFAVNGKAIGRPSLVLTGANTTVKKTEDAFREYTGVNKKLTVKRSNTALIMKSIKVMANYANLRIRVTKARTETKRDKDGSIDGGFVIADVLVMVDGELEALPRGRGLRMFYLRDSVPGDKLDAAAVGDEFIVVGTPRINLDEVLKQTETQSMIEVPLPFEFIVVALIQTL